MLSMDGRDEKGEKEEEKKNDILNSSVSLS